MFFLKNKSFISLMAFFYIILICIVSSHPAHAYVGPGLGAGALSLILGILGTIFLAVFGFIYYPLKRRLRRKKTKNEASATDTSESILSESDKEEA